MIPVMQEFNNNIYGDCKRAVYASLLDLPIDAVPNFSRHKRRNKLVFIQFLFSCGWEFYGYGRYNGVITTLPRIEDSLNGYFQAVVKSKNFEGTSHCVVMDVTGLVVHDPSTSRNYQNENIIESCEIIGWDIVSPRTDDEWKEWLK